MRLNNHFLPFAGWMFMIIPLAMSMEMDMDNMDNNPDATLNDQISTNTSPINSSVEPTAHEMKHHHGLPILETVLTPAERAYWESYNTTTFFTIDSSAKAGLWIHCATLFATFFFIYPITLVLNNVKSKWYLPVLAVNLINVIVSLVSLKIFGANVPNLYPGNAYGVMSWIFLLFTIAHFSLAVLHKASKWVAGIDDDDDDLREAFIPLDDFSNPSDSRRTSGNIHNGNIDLERLAVGGSKSPSTLVDSNSDRENHFKESSDNRDSSQTPIFDQDHDSLDFGSGDEEFHKMYNPKPLKSSTSIQRDHFLNKVLNYSVVQKLSEKFHYLFAFLFKCLNYPMVGYMFVYVSVGICVGNLMGQGNRVFNLLAHFIKGGVFVLLGVFSLARYCGALSKQGHAWNKAIVFKSQVSTNSFWYRWTPRGMITMEGLESFLIFFYGSTNVFLEHLASPGGEWTAKDLQHASIAFMYIGSGLCGLVTEYALSGWRFNQVLLNTNINTSAILAGSPGFSPNPFPVFTIFWTGILMSQHEQASAVSTNIHMQWGYLLSFGSFFRLLTFVLLTIVPNKDLNPSRPFTELITSFALLAGGFIFMESTDQVVEALEYRGLTGMFTLNVNVGLVALLMGWEMLLMAWKYWLQSKKQI